MSATEEKFAVILAGGSGTRLWPLSSGTRPKQLMAIEGVESLLQQTARRLLQVLPPQRIITVTHQDQVYEVEAQLRAIHPALTEHILPEPSGRNTLPAIAWALAAFVDHTPDAVVGVFPADHLVRDQKIFVNIFDKACQAAESGAIVTFGIHPTHASSGYGYIQAGDSVNGDKIYRVDAFVEKPDQVRAKSYLEAGNYYWNSGMFVFRASTFDRELKRLQPLIDEKMREFLAFYNSGSLSDEARQIYASLPHLSIDYGIMEHTDSAVVVPADMQWSDVGSWDALYEISDKDANLNAIQGDVLTIDSRSSLLISRSGLLATVGIENLVVIQTGDAVFVSSRDRVQDVRMIVDELKRQQKDIHENHAIVARPWGQYTVLEEGEAYKIKRIVVEPGHSLSLQKHEHRAEHWVVIKGQAHVVNGEDEFVLEANQSTFIPRGNKHRLSNAGEEPLHIIEVQTGAYVAEDDIVRYEDHYGRK